MDRLVPADHLAIRGGAGRELQPSNSTVSVQSPFHSILAAHWMKVAELWGGAES